jgi:hypothetical protein
LWWQKRAGPGADSLDRGKAERHFAIAEPLVGHEDGTRWSEGALSGATGPAVSARRIAITATAAIEKAVHPRASAGATCTAGATDAGAPASTAAPAPAAIGEHDNVPDRERTAPDLRGAAATSPTAATATADTPGPAGTTRTTANKGRTGATGASVTTGATGGGCGTVGAITAHSTDPNLQHFARRDLKAGAHFATRPGDSSPTT